MEKISLKAMKDLDRKGKVIFGSVALAAILVLVGILTGNTDILGNLFLAAVLVAVLPPFLYRYNKYRWVKSLEDQFPNFVRDLADSKRSGMSFPESVKLATRANYGNLSAEVQRMHNKLSWGIHFDKVLDMFRERARDSKIISESLTIIKESYQSGGDIASTLGAIAADIIMLKETEAERVSMLKQNVMIMYGVFFMFLGIAIMIIFVMIPMINDQPLPQSGGFGFAFTNPCEGVLVFPCNTLGSVGSFLNAPEGIASYYISIFFLVVMVQGIFTGLIAGQIGENSIIAGGKHALIMTFAGIGTFIFLAQAGMFPV